MSADSSQTPSGNASLKLRNPLFLNQSGSEDDFQARLASDWLVDICDEDELRDLAFTFTACDIDDSNSMEIEELHAMLVIQSNSITEQQVDSLMRAGKAEYDRWHAESVPDVDHQTIINRMMKAAGLTDSNKTKHGAERTFAELNLDQDRHRHTGKSQFLDSTLNKAATVRQSKDSTMGKSADQTADSTISKASTVSDRGTIMRTISRTSGRMSQDNTNVQGLTVVEDEPGPELSLTFPEYVFTMKCKLMHDVMDLDAQTLAVQMLAFRNAFDAVSVDDHFFVTYDDLEIITLTLNPRLLLSNAEFLCLWGVMTKPTIAKHKEASGRQANESSAKSDDKSIGAVIQIEGLVKCEYGNRGEAEEVWLSVASDGNMVFRDITDMPVEFRGKWQGEVLRTATAVQSSVRDQKWLAINAELRVDLAERDSCGDNQYTIRLPTKKNQTWLALNQLRKTLQIFDAEGWDDRKAVALNFNEFLQGMAMAQRDESTKQWINVFEPNRWELLSLIIDTPVSVLEEERIYESMSAFERIGVDILGRKRQDMDMDRVRYVLAKASNGALSKLDTQQYDNMTQLHRNAVFSCAMTGLIFAALAAIVENVLCSTLAIDGFKDTYWSCTVESQLDTDPNSTTHGLFIPVYPDLANPDKMRCISVHVNASTCTDGFLDSATVLSADETSGYYPPGISYNNIEDRHDNFGWTPLEKDSESFTMVNICRACECAICGCYTHAPIIGRVEMSFNNKQTWFWALLTPALIVTIGMEICFLLFFAMRYTTLVAWALDFRLTPLNTDRAFVAGSLIRAAFELGNPDSPLLGVDPQQEDGGGSKLLVVAVFKLKVFLTGSVIKAIIGQVSPPHVSLWVKPWLGMVLSTVAWDGYTCHSLMVQARIRGFGVYASVELFNDIMDTVYPGVANVAANMSFFTKVQMARAIGVAIVIHGSLHSSMELLLRHSLQFLGLVNSRVVAQTGILDNRARFLQDLSGNETYTGNPIYDVESKVESNDSQNAPRNLRKMWSRDSRDDDGELSREDKTAVLAVHLLAFVLDGYLDPEELLLWEAVCSVVGPEVAAYYPDKVLDLCRRFSALEPITAQDLLDCFTP